MMKRLIARLGPAALALPLAAALTVGLAAPGCDGSGSPGGPDGLRPGTDDRAKEQKEMDDMMQNYKPKKGRR